MLRGFEKLDVNDLRGALTRLDQIQVPPRQACRAHNVRIEPGRVRSRPGLVSAGFAAGGRVATMHHWLTQSSLGLVNRLVFFESPDKVRVRDLIGAATATFYTLTGSGAALAEAGGRLFVAVYNSAGGGAGEARIVNALISGNPTDKAFSPPMTITPTVTDLGAGNVTAGTHKFAYIMESRTGFTGRPSPGDTFTPVSFSVSSGGRQLRLEINGTMPGDAAYLHAIMTRADNQDRWFFVPDGSIAVPAGSPYVAQITIDISDSALAARATEVSDNFEYLTQNTLGTGPFSPSAVVSLGRRLGYIVYNKLYVSDFDNFQAISEDQNLVQLPGQQQIVTAFRMRGVNYILGPGWTYGVVDNNDYPSTWEQPNSVSDALGTPSIHGVSKGSGGDYRFIANEKGLWLFNGAFPDKPVSYYQEPDWLRINWAVPNQVSVVDVPKEQKVVVNAPLGSATVPTHRLVFDYSRGLSPEKVQFSLDYLGFGDFGSSAVVVDPATGKSAEWIGPGAAGNFRRFDLDARTDDGFLVHPVWESGLMPPASRAKDNRFAGVELEVSGEGRLHVTVFNQGRTEYVSDELVLEAVAKESQLSTFDLVSPRATVRFEMIDLQSWFDLESFAAYWKPYLGARQQ